MYVYVCIHTYTYTYTYLYIYISIYVYYIYIYRERERDTHHYIHVIIFCRIGSPLSGQEVRIYFAQTNNLRTKPLTTSIAKRLITSVPGNIMQLILML